MKHKIVFILMIISFIFLCGNLLGTVQAADEDIEKVKSNAKAAINIDKKSPTILSIKNLSANDSGWCNGTATIEVVVWDRNDIKKLSYFDDEGKEVDLQRHQGLNNPDGSYTFTFETTASEYDGEYGISKNSRISPGAPSVWRLDGADGVRILGRLDGPGTDTLPSAVLALGARHLAGPVSVREPDALPGPDRCAQGGVDPEVLYAHLSNLA